MTELSNKIKLLRESRGWNQEDLAVKLGITRSAIGNYEQGSRRPDYETLESLADTFNVPVGYLLEDERTVAPDTLVVFEMLHNEKTRSHLIKYAELLNETIKGDKL